MSRSLPYLFDCPSSIQRNRHPTAKGFFHSTDSSSVSKASSHSNPDTRDNEDHRIYCVCLCDDDRCLHCRDTTQARSFDDFSSDSCQSSPESSSRFSVASTGQWSGSLFRSVWGAFGSFFDRISNGITRLAITRYADHGKSIYRLLCSESHLTVSLLHSNVTLVFFPQLRRLLQPTKL